MKASLHPLTQRQIDSIVMRPKGTYIFAGAAGAGQREAAITLAQRLHCNSNAGCRECHQIQEGNHPDVIVITPEDAKSIGIDRAKELIGRLSLKQYGQKGHRVVIIDPANLLTIEAQNSLLKTLEELPINTQLILITESAAQLLPTIQSRAMVVHFITSHDQPLADNELIQMINDLPGTSEFNRLTLAGSINEASFDVASFLSLFSADLQKQLRIAVGSGDDTAIRQVLGKQQALEQFARWRGSNVGLKSALSGLLIAL
jgi:hypothetical protein